MLGFLFSFRKITLQKYCVISDKLFKGKSPELVFRDAFLKVAIPPKHL